MPSMREAIGSGNHKTAAAMVISCGMLAVATTSQLRPPRFTAIGAWLLLGGSGATRGPAQKAALLLTKIFSVFKTLAMASASITITTMQGLTGV